MHVMQTNIPFYPSFPTKKYPEGEDCLQMCLKMMLGVLMPGREFTLTELERVTKKVPDGGTFATHYLIWLVDQGFEVKRWDTHDWAAFGREGIEYIRRVLGEEIAAYNAKIADVAAEQTVVPEFLRKVTIVPERPTVDTAERLLNDGWLVRIAVNQRLLNRRPGFVGHSVVLVGFEGDDVIFHDPGLPAHANRRESRAHFQQAMESYGSELDAIRPKS
ncbi:MAG: hypothetical protein K0S68_191 [Candidatus Saccharibacteria bacterium]|nr:hypothetical protein [Candidatus Saccharibacteria bacterium]